MNITFRFTLPSSISALTLALMLPVAAHHGQDFFLLDDTLIPAKGHGLALGTFAFEDEGEDDTLSYSTGVLLGVLPRTALSLQSDFIDEAGAGWAYRSVTPGFHFDLTPPDLKRPIRLGLSAGYQFAETPGEEHHDSGHHDAAEEAEEEAGHHHEAEGHEHSGIHNHDDSLFIGRFVLEADLTPSTLIVANLISVLPDGKSAAWGYGIGLRQKLRPDFSIGVEAIGDFASHGGHEIIGAAYWEVIPHLILKAGAGIGLTGDSPDASFRTGFVWMF
jgi:hypothetical protein